jgi:hypothetical protein
LGVGLVLVAFAVIPSKLESALAAGGVSDVGEAGTVTGLPSTASADTISEQQALGSAAAESPFPNLSVTVNQTQNLVNQDISVSWTGGTQTLSGSPGDFSGDYLQIFECWGDAETTYPDDTGDPGPPPSQCEMGGESSTPTTSYPIQTTGFEYSRVLSQSSWSGYSQLVGDQTTGYSNVYNDTTDGFAIEPFDAVDGTVVDDQADYNYDAVPTAPQQFWLNPYYSFDNTNEVDFARTYSGGTGNQLFQVDTGLEAPGLGCGQDIEPVTGGGTRIPQCWLVVVPRSTPTAENPPTVQPSAVVTSPLTPEAWANRIAFPLTFNPVGSSCSINASSEGIEGSELASQAVSSWQPALCGQSSSTSFSYLTNSDDQARENLTDPTYGSVGMSVFSDPIDPSQTSSTNPVVYAPLTLSGVVIGFNIERVPAVVNGTPVQAEVPLTGSRIQTINLTPRLVAKLLTESYKGQFQEISAVKPSGYSWLAKNPETLFSDPDFIQYNPEFSDLTTEQQVDAGTLLVEEADSDAASTLWKWVLSDPSAEQWLSGQPDPWGMVVNPVYQGNVFGSPTPETFPKSDTYCESLSGADEPPIVNAGVSTPARPLCILDWSPYAQSMAAAAQDASEANDQAKTTYTPTATSADAAWGSNGPQTPGTYVVMTVTDSSSADLYGLQAASLSRSGDDPTQPGQAPVFVPPNSSSLLAGEQAMTKSAVPGVLQTNVATTADNAYALTMLTYAAATPETLSQTDRSDYASFIKYAVGTGQTSGEQPGQLPAGYVPLPSSLQTQALMAAATILNPPPEPSAATTAATSPSESFSTPFESAFSSSVGAASTPSAAAHSTAKRRSMGPEALTSVRTTGVPIGLVRWVLPIGVFIGLSAALFAFAVDRLGRRRRAALEAIPPPPGEVRST